MPNSSKNSMSSIIKKLIKENPKGKYSIQFTINNGELNGHLVSLNKNIKKGGSIEENTNQEELNQLSFSTPPKKSKSNMTKEFRKNYPEDKYDIVWHEDNNGELYPSPIIRQLNINKNLNENQDENQEELNQLSFRTPSKMLKSNMIKEFRKNYPEDKYDMIWYKRNNGELYPSPIRATRILNADLIAKIILIFNLILL